MPQRLLGRIVTYEKGCGAHLCLDIRQNSIFAYPELVVRLDVQKVYVISVGFIIYRLLS